MSDTTHFLPLLETSLAPAPRAIVSDKGYDNRTNREAARERGIVPVIPRRKTARATQKHFPKALYRGRARIEQLFGKIKRFKRISLHCEKTAINFASILALACAFIWFKFVHRA